MRLCEILVRDGTDQCRTALKRFGSKETFRLNEVQEFTKNEWKTHIENLDLRFDQLDEEVESVLRDAHVLCKDVRSFNDYYTPKDNDVIGDTFSFDDEECDAEISDLHHGVPKKFSDNVQLHPYASIVRKRKSRAKSDANCSKRRKSNKPFVKRKVESNFTRVDERCAGEQSCGGSSNRKSKKSTHETGSRFSQDKSIRYHVDGKKVSQSLHSRNRFEKRRRGSSPSVYKGSTSISPPRISPQTYETELESNAEKIDTALPLLTEKIVFEDLSSTHQRMELNETEKADILFDDLSISVVCDKLSTKYPVEEHFCSSLLHRLPLLLNNPHVLDGNSHYVAVSIFETFLKIFQKHGAISLQEMIQVKSKVLLLHLKLLVCVFKILKQNLHSYLKKEDGLIFKVFSISGQCSIVEYIIMQLIDVLYSQLLPNEWGKPQMVPPVIYDMLKNLRDEVGSIVHLTEIVSKLLYKRFQCQKWQKSSIGDERWFVSSIDCEHTANFWMGISNDQAQGKCFLFYFFLSL